MERDILVDVRHPFIVHLEYGTCLCVRLSVSQFVYLSTVDMTYEYFPHHLIFNFQDSELRRPLKYHRLLKNCCFTPFYLFHFSISDRGQALPGFGISQRWRFIYQIIKRG